MENVGYMVMELESGELVHLKTDFGDGAFEPSELPAAIKRGEDRRTISGFCRVRRQ
jgi:hypothetical protein